MKVKLTPLYASYNALFVGQYGLLWSGKFYVVKVTKFPFTETVNPVPENFDKIGEISYWVAVGSVVSSSVVEPQDINPTTKSKDIDATLKIDNFFIMIGFYIKQFTFKIPYFIF